MDFTGTSPENPYSYNAHVQAVVGHISNFIYEYVFYDLPVSSATFAPFDFIFPPGSCLNPDVRAATSCAVMISTGVMSAMHNVFSKMMFSSKDMWQHASASQGNAGNAMVVAGLSQWNLPFADMLAYSINSEGQGGRPTMDGVNAFGFPWCVFGRTPDVEEMELDLPILIPLSNHWKDSCGHGKVSRRRGDSPDLGDAPCTPDILHGHCGQQQDADAPAIVRRVRSLHGAGDQHPGSRYHGAHGQRG